MSRWKDRFTRSMVNPMLTVRQGGAPIAGHFHFPQGRKASNRMPHATDRPVTVLPVSTVETAKRTTGG